LEASFQNKGVLTVLANPKANVGRQLKSSSVPLYRAEQERVKRWAVLIPYTAAGSLNFRNWQSRECLWNAFSPPLHPSLGWFSAHPQKASSSQREGFYIGIIILQGKKS